MSKASTQVQKLVSYAKKEIVLFVFFCVYCMGSLWWQPFVGKYLPSLFGRPTGDFSLPDSSLYISLTNDILHKIPLSHLLISHSWSSLLFSYFLYPIVRLEVRALPLNWIIFLFALIGLRRITQILRIPAAPVLAVLALNPMSFLLSQSFTKELFILGCLPWFFLAFRGRKILLLSLLIIPIICARIYFVPAMILGVLVPQFARGSKTSLALIGGLCCSLPIYYRFCATSFWETSKGYLMENAKGLSHVYTSLMEWPLLAGLMVPLRAIQVVLEPIISRTFYSSDGHVHVYYLASLAGTIILIFASIMTVYLAWKSPPDTLSNSRGDAVFWMSFPWFTITIMITVAALPFIHNRYIYAVLPFIIISEHLLLSALFRRIGKFRNTITHPILRDKQPVSSQGLT